MAYPENVGIGTITPAASSTASDTTIVGDTFFGTSGSWKITSAGSGSFGYLAVNSPGGVGAQIDTSTASATTIGIRVKNSAAQTADVLQIQNSGAAIIAGISATGGGFFADKVGIGTPTPAERLDLGTGNIKIGYEMIIRTVAGGSWTSGWFYATCSAGKFATGGSCTSSSGTAPTNTDTNGTAFGCYLPVGYEAQTYTIKAICMQVR